MLQLFLAFLKIGAMIIGGGYSMLPIIVRELCDNRKWVSEEEILDFFAVAQCTPGVIAVNTATFVGYKLKGVWGAIVATLGVIFAPLVFIFAAAWLIKTASRFEVLGHIFAGVRIAMAALMVGVVIKLVKTNVRDVFSVCIVVAAFILVAIADVSPVFIVLGAVLIGLIYGQIKAAKHD